MKMCDICGKVSGEDAFDSTRNKYLCINCKFGSGEYQTKQHRRGTDVTAEQGAQQTQPKPIQGFDLRQERREDTRIPVLVSLDVHVGGVTSRIFYPATIQNFSQGGICIDWTHCNECSGYSEGSMHPFCIFSQFSANNPNAKELTIRVEVSGQEEVIEFRGQVVYTLKKKNKEYVGITYTHITAQQLEALARICGDT